MAPPDLSSLLGRLDAQADIAQRHIWLIDVARWLRGDAGQPQGPRGPLGRLELLLDAIDSRPGLQARAHDWWCTFVRHVDLTTLLADHGFAPRTAFLSELSDRLRRKLLPGTPETRDASALFRMVLPTPFDAGWIALLDAPVLARLSALTADESTHASDASRGAHSAPRWHDSVMDAITFCTSQVVAAGFSSELRLRMNDVARDARPFHALMGDLDALREALQRRTSISVQPASAQPIPIQPPPVQPELVEGGRSATPPSSAEPSASIDNADAALQAAFIVFRDRLDACRLAAASVYAHLDDNGISVGLVFRLRQLRARVVRIRELLDCLMSATPAAATARLVSRLVIAGGDGSSIRALIASNSSLLAAKVAERSAETGESYITRDRVSYHRMLRKAAGGGALTALTVLLKFAILSVGLSAFWGGLLSGLMYAASFVAIQLLHLTLATKQPAMTAPAMATKLGDLGAEGAIASFVDEVTHLVRSQVAAVLGNVLVVAPVVLALCWLLAQALGAPVLDAAHAGRLLESLSLTGPTLLFAAFTGVLLFAASLVAGWAENAFVLHRLDSAMRYNPRITAVLGSVRAQRWAGFMRSHISGFASNISLGLLLGLVPAFAAFFGLGLDVRHVTLSTGQIAAAAQALGPAVLQQPALWWAVAAIPLIGALNVSVSFYCAFRLALRAHSVSGLDRARIRSAIWLRWRGHPASFFVPSRQQKIRTPTPTAERRRGAETMQNSQK